LQRSIAIHQASFVDEKSMDSLKDILGLKDPSNAFGACRSLNEYFEVMSKSFGQDNVILNFTHIALSVFTLVFSTFKKLPNTLDPNHFSTVSVEVELGALVEKMGCFLQKEYLEGEAALSIESRDHVKRFIIATLKNRLLDPRAMSLLTIVLNICHKVFSFQSYFSTVILGSTSVFLSCSS
jgi:hypothetical protein